jgi:hypothetical protein
MRITLKSFAACLKTAVKRLKRGRVLLGRNRRSVIHVLIFVTSHRFFSHSYSEEGKEGVMRIRRADIPFLSFSRPAPVELSDHELCAGPIVEQNERSGRVIEESPSLAGFELRQEHVLLRKTEGKEGWAST